MNDKSSFVKVSLLITKQLVITKQLKLCFNNSSRIPTQYSNAGSGRISSLLYRVSSGIFTLAAPLSTNWLPLPGISYSTLLRISPCTGRKKSYFFVFYAQQHDIINLQRSVLMCSRISLWICMFVWGTQCGNQCCGSGTFLWSSGSGSKFWCDSGSGSYINTSQLFKNEWKTILQVVRVL
jgi:hypothetical protein